MTDFFNNGVYDKRRKFHLTNAPAMDILVSSNLERLLFDLYDENNYEVASLMNQLTQRGHYQVSGEVFTKLQKILQLVFATEEEVKSEIKRVYNYDRYVIDPHTAVGSFVANQYQKKTGDQTPNWSLFQQPVHISSQKRCMKPSLVVLVCKLASVQLKNYMMN